MERSEAANLLAWYVAMGVDETIGEAPVDRLGMREAVAAPPPSRPAAPPRAPAPPPSRTVSPPKVTGALPVEVGEARAVAAACNSLSELEEAIHGYQGCALSATATKTVFADGHPGAPLMVIGEAPGADEDRIGRPFVGVSGKLLDLMLAAIGRDRGSTYISNVLFWRPPGNRQPTPGELALCLPFVRRQVVLARPKVLIFSGGTASKALLDRSDGITRFRGQWFDFVAEEGAPPIPAMATFHPSYLLRSPGQKREAWKDFIMVKMKLAELGETL